MYEFGSFRLDPARRLLYRDGEMVPLTPKVLDTLLVLVENSGRGMEKGELMKAIWPDTFVEDGNLTQAISTLRKVLGESPGEHAFIETIPKRGYRFVAEVTTKPAAETKVSEAVPNPGRGWRTNLWQAGLLTAVLAMVSATAVYVAERSNVAKPFQVTPLTTYPGLELHPSFSPDGRQVAFAWNGEGLDNLDIYVKGIGSARTVRLTVDAARDFRPAWSPDGRSIAFLRELDDQKAMVLVVDEAGGVERKVAVVDSGFFGSFDASPYLEWSPDGKWLLTPDRAPPDTGSSLYLFAVESSEKRRLTFPPPPYLGDLTGAFSADGRTLVFSRSQSGTLGTICVLKLSADFRPEGDPKCSAISDGRLANFGSLLWPANGREVIFSPLSRGIIQPGLWRMTLAESPGSLAVPQRLALPSDSARDPAISRDGRRLVYSNLIDDADIWRLDLQNANGDPGPQKLIASTQYDWFAQYSPDGEKILFLSSRSGRPAVWVANKDGSSPTQVTFLEAPLTGAPQWSPDSRRIVFDSTLDRQFELYMVNADGGGLRRLTNHPAGDATGSWSRDGQWIYFTSTRSGEHQIWKMRTDGGDLVQLTAQGGFGACTESADGKFVYYAKTASGKTGLWRVPVGRGDEVKVLDSVFGLAYTVTGSGIYFMTAADNGPEIRFLRLEDGKVTPILRIGNRIHTGLSVSPDGRFLLYSFAELTGSDLMLVENFR